MTDVAEEMIKEEENSDVTDLSSRYVFDVGSFHLV